MSFIRWFWFGIGLVTLNILCTLVAIQLYYGLQNWWDKRHPE